MLTPDHPALAWWCPQPVPAIADPVRLERFPRAVDQVLAGQIGPLANARSSSGCAVVVATDSPQITLRLERFRHHQLVPQGLALTVGSGDGAWTNACDSADLREHDGACDITFPTGLERGGPVQACWLWLPPISTCAVAGVRVADGARVERPTLPEPRLLCIGDSLTQGFSVQSPRACWPHRVWSRHGLPAWNLGVGGIRIEPDAFRWALDARRWDTVLIALGSNHGWRDTDAEAAAERCATLAQLACAGGHGRIAWCLPPWKPCEDGQGPPDFAGIPLDRAAGTRIGRVREALRTTLANFPQISVLQPDLPRDHRYYPDGLHPFAIGFARYAASISAWLDSSR